MKKSIVIGMIEALIKKGEEDKATNRVVAEAILHHLIKDIGMEPKLRDYIEGYIFKTDRSWEKE